jgi:4-hydroxyacetophenone monooxygenase
VQVARYLSGQGHLTLFQRSPAWIVPRRPDFDKPLVDASHRRLFNDIPGYERWFRLRLFWELGDKNFRNLRLDPSWKGAHGINSHNEAIRRDLIKYIRNQVGNRPDLVEKLVPTYPPFTKRMVVDNEFYTALAAPDSSVVTDAITAADAQGLWTADGLHHDIDVIVLATGYRSTQFLWSLELRGRSQRTPADMAGGDDEIRAYMGASLPDFPNFFVMQGPNTGAGHGGSLTFAADCQSTFIRNVLRTMLRKGSRTIECTYEAFNAYNRELDQGLETMVWSSGDVTSRFRNNQGRVVGNHPWSWQDVWNRSRHIDERAFRWN